MKRSDIVQEKRKKSFKDKLKIVKNVLLSLVAVLLVVIIVQNLNIKRDPDYIPKIFGCTYLNVLTGSMEPEIKVKDLAIGVPVKDVSKLQVGDVITYKDGRMLITHRITEVLENGNFITKGDANEVADFNEVTKNQIVTKYIFKIPYAGMVIAKLQDTFFLALVWLIIMYFLIKEIFNERKKLKLAASNDEQSSKGA